MICALISPTFSLIRTLTSFLPLIIASRASITQFGQSESVVRGQPRVGLLFCQDFKSGLSDHFGVKEGLGLYLFTDWIVLKRPPAMRVNPFSTCLIGRIGSPSRFNIFRLPSADFAHQGRWAMGNECAAVQRPRELYCLCYL